MTASVGAPGMVSLRYIGKAMTSVWDGQVTNTRYRFGKDSPGPKWVDVRDAGVAGKNGFLNVKDTMGAYVFELVESYAETPVAEEAAPVADVQVTVSDVSQENTFQEEETPVTDEAPEVNVQGDFPEPSSLNIAEIKSLDLTQEQWQGLYQAELAGLNRKGAVTFIEEKLAGG